jgi:hypothetical protein
MKATLLRRYRMPKETKEVMNVWNQPLYLNLPGGRSLKIGTRETAEVEENDLNSPAMLFHRSRGNILVLEAQTQPEAESDENAPQTATASQPQETAHSDAERPRDREHRPGKKGE